MKAKVRALQDVYDVSAQYLYIVATSKCNLCTMHQFQNYFIGKAYNGSPYFVRNEDFHKNTGLR